MGIGVWRKPGVAAAESCCIAGMLPTRGSLGLMRQISEMGVYARDEFSRQVQFYWLIRAKAGAVMICAVVLSLLVGLVLTGQTLYSAVRALRAEYAVLDALGISRWRLQRLIVAKSWWVGLVGVLFAQPLTFAGARAALLLHTKILLPVEAVAGTAVLTLVMALRCALDRRFVSCLVQPSTDKQFFRRLVKCARELVPQTIAPARAAGPLARCCANESNPALLGPGPIAVRTVG
jgi:hypothetical protein